jgi:hypothetical protein
MNDEAKTGGKGPRKRSPSYPYVSLPVAIDRLRAFHSVNKRYEALIADAAQPWNMKPTSSSVLRNVAALVAFGLLDESGSGETRKIRVSDLGLKILLDDRREQKDSLIVDAALKPKAISDCFLKWSMSGDGRPGDRVALSVLKIEMDFSEDAAEHFLRIYDETIKFAQQHGLRSHPEATTPQQHAGKDSESGGWMQEEATNEPRSASASSALSVAAPSVPTQTSPRLSQDEAWVTFLEGPLSSSVRFRLLASGAMGHKELAKLLKLLTIQRAILSEDADDSESTKPD